MPPLVVRIGVTLRTSGHFVLDAFLNRQKLASSDVSLQDYKPQELGAALGCGHDYVSNHLRLLNLPHVWQKRIAEGEVTVTQARELMALSPPLDR